MSEEGTELAPSKNEGSISSIFAKVLFSHVGLFFLVGLYAAFGAYVFVELEKGAELKRYQEKQRAAHDVKDAIDVTVRTIWAYGGIYKNKPDVYRNKTEETINDLEYYILDAISNNNYDGEIETWNYDWSFLNCLLLTISILTTIGYGHIAPKTFEGQLFCIMYAMVGCPLFLVFLANIGDAMANGFTHIYSRLCCRPCRSRRYLEEVPPNHSVKARKLVMDDEVGNERYMPTSKLFVPIIINLLVLHLYMILGGVLFSSWEGWDHTGSFYFTFVTLSTIGFGDLVPGSQFIKSSDIYATLKMIICVTYIALGMALLSMAISLMQEQIIQKCKWVSQQVGMSKDDSVKPADGETAKEFSDKPNTLKPPSEAHLPGTSPYRSRPPTASSLLECQPEEKLPGSSF